MLALTFSLAIPANQRIAAPTPDPFSSTVTFTLASGP